MRVTVKLFAAARDAVNVGEVTIDVDDRATISDLRRDLASAYPQLERMVAHSLFAINAKYANNEDLLTAFDEIACIPPVSGG